jgi:hypothetical protein
MKVFEFVQSGRIYNYVCFAYFRFFFVENILQTTLFVIIISYKQCLILLHLLLQNSIKGTPLRFFDITGLEIIFLDYYSI